MEVLGHPLVVWASVLGGFALMASLTVAAAVALWWLRPERRTGGQ
jgi:hypothetical protein